MNDTHQRQPADDIEALLPWYAAGTLDAHEAMQVEAAVAADAELARRLDLVREEMTEAIVLNEALGVPSARVAEKLFSAIDRERRPARDQERSSGLTGWLANVLSPRAYAFAAGAAALLIVAEAGVIAKLTLQSSTYLPSSESTQPEPAPPQAQPDRGSVPRGLKQVFAQVQFSQQANMADVTRFLAGRQAAIVDGPHSDGSYKIYLGIYGQSDEPDRLVSQFQAGSNKLIASAKAD
jgi:anti-sigma factor RsiW